MSESANVDLVRSMFAAWERGDFTSTEWAHPDIEYIADGPSAGSSTGLAAFLERGREDLSSWENFRVKAEEYRQLDDERVLVLVTFSGRGKVSGLDLAQMQTQGIAVFDVRDDKVVRFARYWDRERAFADLGLAPEGDSP